MAGVNPRKGVFPNADRANLFGTFYIEFYQTWRAQGSKARDACWPSFMGALGLAKSKADEDFKAKIDGLDFAHLSIVDMNALMHEALSLMTRVGTYDYTGVEFADEYDDSTREEDVVSLMGSRQT